MPTRDHDEPAAVGLVDAARPEEAIAEAAAACSNWGRWGDDDARGTLNFLTDGKRVEGARLVRRGVSFSLAQPFDINGPQTGWRRRTNPVHTMLDTGADAARGVQGFPHGFGGADDVVFMPLQCSTQWDGLGHIFDHGRAWNGRDAADVVTSDGRPGHGDRDGRRSDRRPGGPARRGPGPGPRRRAARRVRDHPRSPGDDHRRAGRDSPHQPGRYRADPDRSAGPGPPRRLGRLRRRARPGPVFHLLPRGCTAPKSPRSPPTRGASRYGRTSSTTRSSRCTRWSFRTSGCTSARCGIWKPWLRIARPTAGMSSGSPPRPFPSPARSDPRSTRSRSSYRGACHA